MKKLTLTLLVFIGAAALLTITCPSAETHKTAVKEAANRAVMQEFDGAQGGNEFSKALGGMIGNYVVDNLVESRMSVKNYFVCSVGFLSQLDGSEPQIITVGLLNHVFAPTPEQIRAYVDK